MNINRNQIISTALRRLGVYDQGDTIPSDEINDAALALNLMVKEWMADPNMRLWERKEGFLFTQVGQKQYFLGEAVTPDNFANFTEYKRWTPFCSQFYAAEVEGASGNNTQLKNIIRRPDNQKDLDSVMQSLDQEYCWLGVFMEPGADANYPLEETTLVWLPGTVSISGGDTTVNLLSGFTAGSVPDSFEKVFLVLEKDLLSKPQRLLDMSRVRYSTHTGENPIDTPLEIVALNEYNLLSMKHSSGPATIAQYNPERERGRLQLWPNNDSSVHVVRIYYENPLSSFSDLSSEAEFPEEWYNALVWGLAAELASEYALPMEEREYAAKMATAKKLNLMAHDQEQGSLYFEMSYQGRY